MLTTLESLDLAMPMLMQPLVSLAVKLPGAVFLFTSKCSGSVSKFIGLQPSFSPPAWWPRPDRLALLAAALEQVASWRVVTTRITQGIVAHFVHWAVPRRPALTIPHAAYQFLYIDARVGWPRPIWRSMREELVWMRGVLSLLRTDVDRAVALVVLAQDAAGPTEDASYRTGAFCLAVGLPPFEEVAKLSKRRELQGKALLPVHRQDTDISACGFETAVPRTVIPRNWFSTSAGWELLLARRWHWPMHINVGEARAALS
jgi:hypothetical protein